MQRDSDTFLSQKERGEEETAASSAGSDMALWADSKLFFFCILFITFCFSMTRAEMAVDCCLSVSQKQIRKERIVDYQDQAKGCAVAATILVTRAGRNLCVPPNKKWVRDVMVHVDKLKELCRENSYKDKRCWAVKRTDA